MIAPSFPVLLLVFAGLIAWQIIRDLVLIAASLYLAFRIWKTRT